MQREICTQGGLQSLQLLITNSETVGDKDETKLELAVAVCIANLIPALSEFSEICRSALPLLQSLRLLVISSEIASTDGSTTNNHLEIASTGLMHISSIFKRSRCGDDGSDGESLLQIDPNKSNSQFQLSSTDFLKSLLNIVLSISALPTNPTKPVSTNIAIAMANVSHCTSARLIILQNGGLPLLLSWLADSTKTYLHGHSASALACLCDVSNTVNDVYTSGFVHAQIINSGTIEVLVPLSKTDNEDVRIGIARGEPVSPLCVDAPSLTLTTPPRRSDQPALPLPYCEDHNSEELGYQNMRPASVVQRV